MIDKSRDQTDEDQNPDRLDFVKSRQMKSEHYNYRWKRSQILASFGDGNIIASSIAQWKKGLLETEQAMKSLEEGRGEVSPVKAAFQPHNGILSLKSYIWPMISSRRRFPPML